MVADIGDKIMIKIGDVAVVTVIDEHGTQRLPSNSLYMELYQSGALGLDDLYAAHYDGDISFDNYLEFYLNIGYSVGGFSELSAFQHLEIKNPVWED